MEKDLLYLTKERIERRRQLFADFNYIMDKQIQDDIDFRNSKEPLVMQGLFPESFNAHGFDVKKVSESMRCFVVGGGEIFPNTCHHDINSRYWDKSGSKCLDCNKIFE